ncbi:PqiC family protein [Tropicibacter oceani]|uniref:ABC-type transport auxiliary lipoprotein family protein n=1 Tax=Tropicibacter oceani TaxID=3058420 RepID=A0ABY8QGV7_9RHOB|nr:ABC-type transport auxiliary lipoprotein family protein [Tropicibacter oceani]WGW03759.1 ABC-type transport auxiliary lipoprotein family protein [Tropicibacter oceani]
MTKFSLTLAPLAFSMLALGACSGVEQRFDAPVAAEIKAERVSSRYARIEVAAVTLPTYAQAEEIHVRDASGAITPTDALWADEPGRAVTLQIARELDAITGRLVAPEPWPFRDIPDVKVDVRVQDFYATETGAFRISGQVFVAPEEQGPDRAKRFEIEALITGEPGPAQIAAARAEAVAQLSVFIAKNGLR